MNIFAVDADPQEAAIALADVHVVKMTLETAQILCTVLWGLDVPMPYKATHASHPCVKWTASSRSNFDWLVHHGLSLGEEYEHRYGRVHASSRVIAMAAEAWSKPDLGPMTPFALAMPDEFRCDDHVASYRRYYHSKTSMCRWTHRLPPAWWTA